MLKSAADASSNHVEDVEAGYAEPTERETLLAERRTSSTEEEVPTLSQDQSERIRSLELSNKRQSPQSSPPDEQNIQRDKLKGLGLAALTTVFTALTSVFAKITGQSGIPVFELLVVRGTMIFSISYLKAMQSTQHAFPHTCGKRKWLLTLRGVVGFANIATMYGSLQYLPLADALVFTFLSPLVVAALASIFNQELPSLAVVASMLASLIGVAMIAQPPFLFGGQSLNKLGLLLSSMQVFTAAFVTIILRELRKTDTTDLIMLYSGTMQGLCAIATCLVLPGGFVAPQHLWQVVMMLLLGAFAYPKSFCYTAALQLLEAAPVMAMSYLSVVWGVLLDLAVFKQVPGRWELLGAFCVCSTTLLLGWHQKQQKQ